MNYRLLESVPGGDPFPELSPEEAFLKSYAKHQDYKKLEWTFITLSASYLTLDANIGNILDMLKKEKTVWEKLVIMK